VPTPVYLESGSKRVFACSLDWPGWCRSGKDADAAVEALAASADRYRAIADGAGVRFPRNAAGAFDIVERLQGGGATDFGVPYEIPKADARPLTRAQATRQTNLVLAAWAAFDRVVAGAPETLRKGPRGGGRDRDKILEHVVAAEASYARSMGIRMPAPDPNDRPGVTDLRDAIAGALRKPSDGKPLAAKGWPPRYAARRVAWHAIDHAWEIEDRTE